MSTKDNWEEEDIVFPKRLPKLKSRLKEMKEKLAIKKRQSKAFIAIDYQHAKIMACLVPDEVIYHITDYSIREFEVVLILGDVSGFTDLSEKYNKTGRGGPSKLTQILNRYIGAMVQEIITHSGDLLKFSGDAYLAMWRTSHEKSMQDVLTQVLDCALVIQKNYGRYETDIGVTLKVKLGVAAGHVFFSIIGDEKLKHYVILGEPVWDVKEAEHLCSAGEVMLAPSAWNHVNVTEYQFEYHHDGHHVKITGVGSTWQQDVDIGKKEEEIEEFHSATEEITDVDKEELFPLSYSERTPKPEAGPILMSLSGIALGKRKKQKEFSVRPSVDEAASKKGMKALLRPFINPPVMKGVDMDEPLDYLTEMRQVVIMFLNIIPLKLGWKELVQLGDKSYQTVCSLVDAAEGCVNKVSFFDKDLMMLIIFGLRGFKHDLESQIALTCAADVRSACAGLNGIKYASVGVTTGMTYCGVVGHILRREYTVIGVPVNKAARLMVAYPGKVTCDREVFLQSKLEAQHFYLQEPKELKGLHSIGPIYEYKEESVTQGLSTVNKFPLLGRGKELKVFSKMFEKMQDNKMHKNPNLQNVLIMKGEPREGKSRLLDEMIYLVREGVMVHKVSLNNRDYKVPYSTIQLIFAPTLNVTEKSAPKEKEDKLMLKFTNTKNPQLLCCLNPVFNVNFEMSELYLSYNAKKKKEALGSVLMELFHVCFTKLWVCGIDDSEFIDDASWKLLLILIEANCIFFVMALGTRRLLTSEIAGIVNHKHIKFIHLSGIDKWYHAGLACQILDVQAIPVELEKVIQSRSKGNPGWVESYLVSLIQAGGLLIRNIPKNEISDLGLVAPPTDMMVRTGTPVDDKQERDDKLDLEFYADEWKMYELTYKESQIKVERVKEKSRSKTIAVCTMAPNFQLEEVDSDVTIDVMMLKVFDSLTSFEQLLLKCSSVLGETFLRVMLIYIMATKDIREISLAVMKLFEIRVLECGKGYFSQGDNFMLYRKHSPILKINNTVCCECIGNKIDDECFGLPKYASCGLMQFCMPLFRDTTYCLLIDNQKKEYHLRAIKFLERETRRCQSCGGGNFLRLLGQRYDENLRRFANRNKKLGVEIQELTKKTEEPKTSSTEDMIFDGRSPSISGDPEFSVDSHLQIENLDKKSVTSTNRRTLWRLLPLPCVTNRKSSISLTRSFSTVDYTNCQCPLILNTMYTMLVEHCRGAARFDKLMDGLLEFAVVGILSWNHAQVLKVLDEAAQLIEQGKLVDEDIPSWRIPYIRGRIHTLRGYSHLAAGQLQDAATELYTAMRKYGYKYPHYSFLAHISSKYEKMKLMVVLELLPKWAIGRAEGYYAEIADHMSECLSLMCILFKVTQHWRLAELAALWGLNKALESDSDFFGMCTAYSNLIDVANHFGHETTSWRLEQSALAVCQRKATNVERNELEAVARLYFAIFNSRLLRAESVNGINMGFKTLRICTSIHATCLKLQLLPLMITILMMRQRISECVSLLTELEYVAVQDIDKSGRTWYFALCVDFQLETGYCLIPFKKCEQYFQEEGDSMITSRDPDAKRRYFISMWLWFIRNEDWEAATVWAPYTHDISGLLEEESIANILTAEHLLEGLLLYLVGKVDRCNVKAISSTCMEITLLIKHISNTCKTARIAVPRFMILKAYNRQIHFHDPKAMKQLMQAKAIAQKHGNFLDLQWSEHNEKVWTGTISPVMREFWKEHCHPDNLLLWHEGLTGNTIMFSLPIPRRAI